MTITHPMTITAFHEAGHALAADELNVCYGSVSIAPDKSKSTLGRVLVEGDEYCPFDTDDPVVLREWADVQAAIDYAGHAAVVALLGIGSMSEESGAAHGAGDDFEKARARLGGDLKRIEQAQARALEIVKARGEEIRVVAVALLERVTLTDAEITLLLVYNIAR